MTEAAGVVRHLGAGWRRFRRLRARWQAALVLGLLLVPGVLEQHGDGGTRVRGDGPAEQVATERGTAAPTGAGGAVDSTTSTTGAVEASSRGGDEGAATVQRVVDGDTLVLADGTKVRLIGVDTPETKKPGSPVECFGPEASHYTEERFGPGTAVRVAYDVEHLDRYGRTLVYLYRVSDGLFLNLELVRDGFAVVATFPPNVAHVDEFVAAQRSAREANRGLWGARCPSSSASPTTTPSPGVAPPPATTATSAPVASSPTPAAPTGGDCHASYDPCVPVASDADCASGSGNGPVYVDGPVDIIGPDEYGLDSDHDGVGCE